MLLVEIGDPAPRSRGREGLDVRRLTPTLLLPCVLLACGSRTGLETPPLRLTRDDAGARPFHCSSDAEIDVLLLIDSSPTFRDDREQSVVTAVEVLNPIAECARVRLGVLSNDLGGGVRPSPPCTSTGDDARLLTLGGAVDYVEGGAHDLGATLRDALLERPEGCGFERPLEVARRFIESSAFQTFDRPGAPNVLLYVTEEDDCSPIDADILFDPAGPYGSINRNVLCNSVPASSFVSEREVAEAIAGASTDILGFALIAGFEPEDVAGGIDAAGLRRVAAEYASSGSPPDLTCAGRAFGPVRLATFAAELESLDAAVSVGSVCTPSGAAVGRRLVAVLGEF